MGLKAAAKEPRLQSRRPRNPNAVIAQLAELTRQHWQGTTHDDFHMYAGELPIVVIGMTMLHASMGATARRSGRQGHMWGAAISPMPNGPDWSGTCRGPVV
ncbi:hypothetical protein [Streptomyces yokosukanensis]|uniref:hypothetical protein n=1 Tax=Streptomyces yokosukanensis TaxID=67386 RepID=UPI000A3E4C4C|nr:hypothetical protein [Streptomyces yokosukanensis]